MGRLQVARRNGDLPIKRLMRVVFATAGTACLLAGPATATTPNNPIPLDSKPACVIPDTAERMDAAIATCDHVLSDKGLALATQIAALRTRGLMYMFKGDREHALADLDRAVEQEPTDATSLFSRGIVQTHFAAYEDAIADFTKALSQHPTTEAYLQRGKAYVAQGDLDKAGSDYDQAIALGPDNIAAQSARAQYYVDRGMIDEAGPALQHLKAANPARPETLDVAIGYDDLMADFTAEMVDTTAALDAATTQSDQWNIAYYLGWRAIVDEFMGDTGKADADMAAALKTGAGNSSVRSYHCLLLTFRNNLTAALPICDAALRTSVNKGYDYDDHGYLQMRRGKWSDALLDLTQAIASDKSVAAYYFDRAFAEEHLGKKDDADHDYARARAMNRHIDESEKRYGIVAGAKDVVSLHDTMAK